MQTRGVLLDWQASSTELTKAFRGLDPKRRAWVLSQDTEELAELTTESQEKMLGTVLTHTPDRAEYKAYLLGLPYFLTQEFIQNKYGDQTVWSLQDILTVQYKRSVLVELVETLPLGKRQPFRIWYPGAMPIVFCWADTPERAISRFAEKHMPQLVGHRITEAVGGTVQVLVTGKERYYNVG